MRPFGAAKPANKIFFVDMQTEKQLEAAAPQASQSAMPDGVFRIGFHGLTCFALRHGLLFTFTGAQPVFCQAVGKIGGIGNSSGLGSSGNSGSGTVSGSCGIDGLKSGSGVVWFDRSQKNDMDLPRKRILADHKPAFDGLIAFHQCSANEPFSLIDGHIVNSSAWDLLQKCGWQETIMKSGNHLPHSHRARTKWELNNPVLLWVGGLGAFWTTVAFLIFM